MGVGIKGRVRVKVKDWLEKVTIVYVPSLDIKFARYGDV